MTEAEYEAEKYSVQCQMTDCENQGTNLQDKIDRMEVVYDQIKTIKTDVEDLKWKTSSEKEQEETWKGKEYHLYGDRVTDLVSALDTYWSNLDGYHDDLMDEITKLKNEQNDNDGAWGWLKSRWNDLCSMAGQAFN